MKIQIVKVQLSLHTNCNKRQMLVYNKDNSIFWQGNTTKAVKKIMKGLPKKYFYGWVNEHKQFVLDDEAPVQDW